MKPLTSIILVVYIIIYLFLPLYNVSFDGSWIGLEYTSDTISLESDPLKIIFALIPFIATFGGIAVNCMKNRYWGLVVAVFVALGLYFYCVAKDFESASALLHVPQFYSIDSLGSGFNIGYIMLYVAFGSAILSVFPFKFNKYLAREIRKQEDFLKKSITKSKSTPDEN